ncbi:unnamed protein product [Discosporangium mesarthrocarpum]
MSAAAIEESPSCRGSFLTHAAALAATGAIAVPSYADDAETDGQPKKVPYTPTKLGGTLEPFGDTQRGFKISKPLGWNKYDGVGGEYLVKMVDLVDVTQVILLTTSPVKSDTTLASLGSVASVAEKLGKGKEIITAGDRLTEGIRFMDFEFQAGDRHELKTLCVYKSKLWNLTIGCPEKSWPKRETIYKTVVTSFLPRL